MNASATLIQFLYLVASALFLFGLRGLTSPTTARRGVFFAELGMLLAIVGTLLRQEIVTYEWIILGAWWIVSCFLDKDD